MTERWLRWAVALSVLGVAMGEIEHVQASCRGQSRGDANIRRLTIERTRYNDMVE